MPNSGSKVAPASCEDRPVTSRNKTSTSPLKCNEAAAKKGKGKSDLIEVRACSVAANPRCSKKRRGPAGIFFVVSDRSDRAVFKGIF